MEPFQNCTGLVVPLPIKDVDTDMIIPADYLTSIGREGYGQYLFKRLCDQNLEFPFNLEEYREASILLAEDNFGCGSSREHAVWALLDRGIKVIIAPSFADIFKSNAFKNGLVLVTLSHEQVNDLMRAAQSAHFHLTIDLIEQTIATESGDSFRFDFDPFLKECLLRGYDDLSYLMAHNSDIQAYQKKRAEQLFYSTLFPNHPHA